MESKHVYQYNANIGNEYLKILLFCVASVLSRFMETTVESLQELWSDFLQQTGDLTTHSNRLQVTVDQNTCTVTIWGYHDNVVKETSRLQNIVTKLEQQLDKDRKSITETVSVLYLYPNLRGNLFLDLCN